MRANCFCQVLTHTHTKVFANRRAAKEPFNILVQSENNYHNFSRRLRFQVTEKLYACRLFSSLRHRSILVLVGHLPPNVTAHSIFRDVFQARKFFSDCGDGLQFKRCTYSVVWHLLGPVTVHSCSVELVCLGGLAYRPATKL